MGKTYDTCKEAPPRTFSSSFNATALEQLATEHTHAPLEQVDAVLSKKSIHTLEDFAILLSDKALERLERLATLAQRATQQHFGKTVRLFAPLYLSNECVNVCQYCGFSRTNDIPRITLAPQRVEQETQKLAEQGFHSVLLVAGEHPKHVSGGYVQECIERCLQIAPSIALELGPLETPDYQPLVQAGAEALVVYQETYHYDTYKNLHTSGPKRSYAWRMDAPQRAYAAGFRRLGIGTLCGLYAHRYELISLAAHAQWLLKHCWKSQIALSILRLRPSAGSWQADPQFAVDDKTFVQALCALRLLLPQVHITLSTREPAHLRDQLFKMSVTTMSAGSCTEPGGYTHYDPKEWKPRNLKGAEQFSIDDERSPKEVARMIADEGYEPVWKDFEENLVIANLSS